MLSALLATNYNLKFDFSGLIDNAGIENVGERYRAGSRLIKNFTRSFARTEGAGN